jgi:uncharacterized membrane protein required for colicin V production
MIRDEKTPIMMIKGCSSSTTLSCACDSFISLPLSLSPRYKIHIFETPSFSSLSSRALSLLATTCICTLHTELLTGLLDDLVAAISAHTLGRVVDVAAGAVPEFRVLAFEEL